jgi:HPr kinase/phosphorylase
MNRPPSLADVFDRLRDPLGLEAVHLDRARDRALPPEPPNGGFPTLIGHLNLVQPNRIQVLGPAEIRYWNEQSDAERSHLLGQLFRDDLYGIIISDDLAVPADIGARARHEGTCLLRATSACEHVIDRLRHELDRDLATRIVLHGVFLDVLGIGTLLTGVSDVGKSELALELISRGHSLVADDAPEFSRPAPGVIEGECPAVIQDFLEVSGMGVLNIRAMYGDSAIRHRKRLELIIHLEPLTSSLRRQLDRLSGNFTHNEVLGVPITAMTLPVAPGRNLAVMVEAAVRNYLLTHRGYHAAEELMQRQEDEMQGDRQ